MTNAEITLLIVGVALLNTIIGAMVMVWLDDEKRMNGALARWRDEAPKGFVLLDCFFFIFLNLWPVHLIMYLRNGTPKGANVEGM